MNSMENRVYEVEIESDSDNPSEHFKIIKFYRPGRWSKIQIQEEHDTKNLDKLLKDYNKDQKKVLKEADVLPATKRCGMRIGMDCRLRNF